MCNPRRPVMEHVLSKSNLVLCTNRQVNEHFQHVLAANNLITDCTLSTATRERTYAFPLYLYPAGELFDGGDESRRSNLALGFVEELSGVLNIRFLSDGQGDLEDTYGPEDVFHYAYAIFHSPDLSGAVRRVPQAGLPPAPPHLGTCPLQRALRVGAEELVALHLMRLTTASTTRSLPFRRTARTLR